MPSLKSMVRAYLPKVTVRQIRIDREIMMRYMAAAIDRSGHHVEVGAGTGLGGPLTGSYGFRFEPRNCYLIEACPVNFAELRKNCPDANLFHMAIAASDGEVKFYTVDDPNWIGSSKSNSLHYAALADKFPADKIREVSVPAMNLGRFYAENQLASVEVLWLNCEGAEYEIFNGDVSFLDRTRFVWLDMHGHTRLYSRNVPKKLELYDLFVQRGFTRVGGHRREDIPQDLGHLTFLWERMPA